MDTAHHQGGECEEYVRSVKSHCECRSECCRLVMTRSVENVRRQKAFSDLIDFGKNDKMSVGENG